MMIVASLILSAALAADAAPPPPEFNRQEPISLDLKDASVTEVITLLGALANVPVSIAPDVTGTVSLQFKDVPYAKVLEMISEHNALSIRFEGGKLVATRLKSASSPAPRLERGSAGPRIPVEEYSRANSSPKPVYVRIRGNGVETCARLDFGGGASHEVPLPGTAESAVVTQFGWDAVSRKRFLVIEAPGEEASAFVLEEAGPLSIEPKHENGFAWSVAVRGPKDACRDAVIPARRTTSKSMLIRLRLEEKRDGAAVTVMAPRVHPLLGIPFSMRSGISSESGQHDEVILFGYVTRDGESLAIALMGTAVRTDPKDGKEYVYSQLGSGRGLRIGPIPEDERQLATLPAGSLWPRPLELSGSVVRDP